MYSFPTIPLPTSRFLQDYAVRYRFSAYRISDRPEAANCVYVFARNGVPLYIGQAARLSSRLLGHEKLLVALLLGADELWVHVPGRSDTVRYGDAERRLINAYNPELNVLHRTGPAIGLGLALPALSGSTGLGLAGMFTA